MCIYVSNICRVHYIYIYSEYIYNHIYVCVWYYSRSESIRPSVERKQMVRKNGWLKMFNKGRIIAKLCVEVKSTNKK